MYLLYNHPYFITSYSYLYFSLRKKGGHARAVMTSLQNVKIHEKLLLNLRNAKGELQQEGKGLLLLSNAKIACFLVCESLALMYRTRLTPVY